MTIKLDENICILPRCEEPILLVYRMEFFCVEQRKRFYDYFSSYEVSSEVDNMLKIDEEFRNEFLTDIVYEFCYEEIEEWHKNNTFPINKKKKNKEEEKTKVDKITMKKVNNKDTINHNLMIVDVDLQKCLNCSFVIQKIDEQWFTINTGDKNCGK